MASSILLKNGTVLTHDAANHITASKSDVLIDGQRIAKIAPSIQAPSSDTQVIDCSDKIVSPGFIDTHRHTWQTQLKARHADELLKEYMLTGNMVAALYDAPEVYWGQIGGALESIDAGTTTIVDHSHVMMSPDHARAALNGLIDTGVRAVFCPAAANKVKAWEPKLEWDNDLLPEWFSETVEKLGKESPWADGRVTFGFAYDLWFLGEEVSKKWVKKVRDLGVKTITTHAVGGPMNFMPVQDLSKWGLLGPDILLSHASCPTPEDEQLIKSAGAKISTTPATELQMSHGDPVCFRKNLAPLCSLGIDCHSCTAADIMGQMRMLIQHARCVLHGPYVEDNKDVPPEIGVGIRTEEVFNLGTIKGAEAIGMAQDLGSVAEGKLADLIIWDMTSPGMICGAAHDPVAAIMLHSSVKDVDTVIVDGQIRKLEGRLLPVTVSEPSVSASKRSLDWKAIAKELTLSRNEVQAKIDKLDYPRLRKEMA